MIQLICKRLWGAVGEELCLNCSLLEFNSFASMAWNSKLQASLQMRCGASSLLLESSFCFVAAGLFSFKHTTHICFDVIQQPVFKLSVVKKNKENVCN